LEIAFDGFLTSECSLIYSCWSEYKSVYERGWKFRNSERQCVDLTILIEKFPQLNSLHYKDSFKSYVFWGIIFEQIIFDPYCSTLLYTLRCLKHITKIDRKLDGENLKVSHWKVKVNLRDNLRWRQLLSVWIKRRDKEQKNKFK
jgi:hypothetical protein